MFGNNPKRKPDLGSGESLDIQEILLTLQGEGPYQGQPAVFIRLGGCNLACHFCDTEFESFSNLNLNEITAKATQLSRNLETAKLIVITGGEPFRQNISLLCEQLIELGFLVQIETNGTLYQELPAGIKIICSPKNNSGKYHYIREDLLKRIDAFKFIIAQDQPNYNYVPEVGQTANNIPVYVQPMDEYDEAKNKQNTTYCLELALKHGYFFSIQLHKILDIA
ncbi:7-carboxy-7-deazaguanine synthase QueE [Rickettsiales endosymbiont of Stachyamoeba lipophora]|uniref:7-carboxy-7-deazaguanine synthase QueE n=1 Tax=Rickettsiales endosymbiont of Stachyamoeba lipophora TaxID=2486578 RepID=UPI000F6466AE|nr:7-carboxy-7-deazaguanine synthase QueE [Rickettsiales endosymbiont of Stachyamoeba lipophora]AZL15083.1 7-carboxy-7-deazaguanine synthase QueE [Rickettsiales endosymbiont of Stachyamoeba lipophora]